MLRQFGVQLPKLQGTLLRCPCQHRPRTPLACDCAPSLKATRTTSSRRAAANTHCAPDVTTILDKELKRQVTVDGVDYTIAIDPDGVRVTGKGKRRPQVELRWRDLLSGDAALAVALNASLTQARQPATQPMTGQPARATKRVPKKLRR